MSTISKLRVKHDGNNFICNATGALCGSTRYAIIDNEKKYGAFFSLPVMARWITENIEDPETCLRLLTNIKAVYGQPDVPLAPESAYLREHPEVLMQDQHQRWTRIPGVEQLADYIAAHPKRPRKKKDSNDALKVKSAVKKTVLQVDAPGVYLIKNKRNAEKALSSLPTEKFAKTLARFSKADNFAPMYTKDGIFLGLAAEEGEQGANIYNGEFKGAFLLVTSKKTKLTAAE